MLRSDEKTAWTGFLTAAPLFADEAMVNWSDGPDPPDVLCSGVSSKAIGVELTKWVEHNQVTDEAMLHNTPIHSVGYGFPQLAEQVRHNLRTAPKVFDRIFLFHPYEAPKAIRVY